MEIASKWGANYLIVKPNEYKPNPETLYFGKTEIKPGTRIKKIGIKVRSCFELKDDLYMTYEGTLMVENVKHCIFAGTWNDQELMKETGNKVLFKFAFAVEENTSSPTFLLRFTKNGKASSDIDCTHVELLN